MSNETSSVYLFLDYDDIKEIHVIDEEYLNFYGFESKI